MRIGVLALQGDFAAHARVLRGLGAELTPLEAPFEPEVVASGSDAHRHDHDR